MGVIYEVNLVVDQTVIESFLIWLRSHVLEMLQFQGFESADVSKYAETAGAIVISYKVKSMEDLEDYFNHNAERMRNDGLKRFGDGVKVQYYVLNDGNKHPTRGFGTYKLGFIPASASGQNGVASVLDEDVTGIVVQAVKSGYRMFDCAEYYGNEERVGEAISRCGISREELFIISKVWSSTIDMGPDAVRAQVLKSLKDLQIEYFDLYLIHWPVPTKHIQAYKVLETLQKEGLIKSIGVSNYTKEDYEELVAQCEVKPAVNQIEVNPFMFRKNTIDYFQKQGCLIQGYRCLANGKLTHPLLISLASKYHVPVSAIMLRFLLQQGISFIGKSSKLDRIHENFCPNAGEFSLTSSEIEQLQNLTTPEAITSAYQLYRKCVIRDTSVSQEHIRQDSTFN